MKNKRKLLTLLGLISSLALILSGCSTSQYQNTKPPTGFFYGSVYKYLAKPMQSLLQWFADWIGGSNGFGWGIVIITVIINLILLPLMLNQMKKSTAQTEKMKAVKPQIDLIQKHRAHASNAEAAKLSQLTMEVYQKNNLSMTGAIGCLPLLLQLPIFMALYQAVQYSPEIAQQTFFGIPLGQRSILITIIATVFYAIQAVISMIDMPKDQRKQMAVTVVLGPGMMLMVSLVAPAGLTLYFMAGGFVSIIRQVLITFVMNPRIKRRIDAELKEHPVVTVVDEDTFAQPETSTTDHQESQKTHADIRARNAGKQKQRPRQ